VKNRAGDGEGNGELRSIEGASRRFLAGGGRGDQGASNGGLGWVRGGRRRAGDDEEVAVALGVSQRKKGKESGGARRGKKGEARVCRGLEEIKRGGGVVVWWRRSVT
jgi:hypothetical protein